MGTILLGFWFSARLTWIAAKVSWIFFIIFSESSASTLTLISSFPFRSFPFPECRFRFLELIGASSSELEEFNEVVSDLLLELDSEEEPYFRLLLRRAFPFSSAFFRDFRSD